MIPLYTYRCWIIMATWIRISLRSDCIMKNLHDTKFQNFEALKIRGNATQTLCRNFEFKFNIFNSINKWVGAQVEILMLLTLMPRSRPTLYAYSTRIYPTYLVFRSTFPTLLISESGSILHWSMLVAPKRSTQPDLTWPVGTNCKSPQLSIPSRGRLLLWVGYTSVLWTVPSQTPFRGNVNFAYAFVLWLMRMVLVAGPGPWLLNLCFLRGGAYKFYLNSTMGSIISGPHLLGLKSGYYSFCWTEIIGPKSDIF